MVALPEGFDFTDPDLYAERLPMAEFAELRRTAPVWWNRQPRRRSGYDDEGYWVVTRHADVKEVSRRSDVFSSWENTAIIRYGEDTPREQIEAQRLIMINIDPPQHTGMRKIVQRGFTPRAIAGLEEALRERARTIVTEARERGGGDFVTDVARELPLQAIAELMGVPQEHRGEIFDWSNQMIGYDDPEYDLDPGHAAVEMLGYFGAMAEQRRGCPMDDIVTRLVHADVDGSALSTDEFGFFVILLAVAGNETTRNAITHGMLAFLDHPEQWEHYRRHRPATTADEIVRWATPVVSFQRTALVDTELAGVPIGAGERVGMFYSSANFDPEVFDEPERFDITRDPNPHVGFGGTGPHYCLGASLARLEIDLIFNAIADHMPGISQVGQPRRLRSGWLNGIKELQVRYE
ncbi:cytochrome P450 [Saccharopolyspora sp. CA-218241]|uniref:cytochrome P450 n=1 Tax=Saccharopolyspora sp. CA-218241 TaxID=3240027 RepID=UPI003D96749A